MQEQEQVVDMIEEEDERLSVDFLSSLHEFMDKKETQELEINTEDETFRIKTKEQAGFFIRKVQEVRSEMQKIDDTANKEIDRLVSRINEWRNSELNKCKNAESYLVTMLQSFASTELVGSDKKSIKLPFGTLLFKKQQDKYDYDDEVLLAFLKEKEMNDYIQTKHSPKKAELKKAGEVLNGQLNLNGTPITGITVTVQDEKFEVK